MFFKYTPRLWSVLLAGCLLLGGCGADSEKTKPDSQTRPVTDDASAPIEISFWYAAASTGTAVMEEIVEGFNQSQSRYHANARVFGNYTEITNQVQAGIATGTAPDVAVLERDVSLDLHSRGLTANLTEALSAEPRFTPDRFLSVYYDQGIAPDGCLCAVPLYGTTQVLYYNKEAFRSAGIDPASIHTWQDLSEAAAEVQAGGEYDWGWEPMWGYENMLDAALSNGGSVFSDDGRTVTINAPEWVEVWETFRRWLNEDRTMRIHSGGVGWEYWDYTRLDALEGRSGGYTGSSGDQADVDFDIVGMLEQPAWSEDKEAQPEAKALMLNVLSNSSWERRQGAYALIRWLVDVPAQVQWSTGTGYIAVNQDVLLDDHYRAYMAEHEYAQIPLIQSMHAALRPVDPTGGILRETLVRAADRVQIENLSAQDALDEAQRTAQRALDAALAVRESGAEPGVVHSRAEGRTPDAVTQASQADWTARESGTAQTDWTARESGTAQTDWTEWTSVAAQWDRTARISGEELP